MKIRTGMAPGSLHVSQFIESEPDGKTSSLHVRVVTMRKTIYTHGKCGQPITGCDVRYYCHRCDAYWDRRTGDE